MKIAIDLHGTYTENIDEYNQFISAIIGKKYVNWNSELKIVSVFIFSGSPENEIRDYLRDKMPKDIIDHPNFGILSVVDFCREHNLPMMQKPSTRTGITNWYIDGPEEIWWSMKSVICSIYDITILVDDKLEYSKYFGEKHKTQFVTDIHDLLMAGTCFAWV